MKGPWALYRGRVERGELTADPAQDQAARRLDILARQIGQWRPEGFLGLGAQPAPPGLYIHGAVGRGKSMLMDLFFEAAPIKKKRRAHFHAFMQAQHTAMRAARAAGETGQDRLIQALARDIVEEARLLCFDELQVTDIADAMILGRLFAQLFEHGIVLVATSNRRPDDLYKNGLNRQLVLPFIDLLNTRLDVLELTAARDFRRDQLASAPVYYTPLNAFAEAAMDRAWARLTSGAAPQPMTLQVQGRETPIARTAAGCARVSFAELCEAPLGPADYLALAQRFHTVLLEGVPRLTPDRREAAARFRILIDALYEAKTKLVMSAAAEPEALYPAGAQSFEFERTASRLHEMRAAAYLALPHRDAEYMRGLVE